MTADRVAAVRTPSSGRLPALRRAGSRSQRGRWPPRLRLSLALALVLGAAVATPAPASGQQVQAFDASESAGIFEVSRSWGASVHDVDRDGWDDVLISRHWGYASRLYRNDRSGAFEEAGAGTFMAADRHGCAWADVDGDDLPDAFCAMGGGRGAARGKPDELWIQQPDGTFVDEHQRFGLDGSYDRGRHATFVDVNHDAHPDLYVANGYPRRDGHRSLNRLFINEGGKSFRSAPGYRLNREVGGDSVQAVDYDADGWEDLLVCDQDGRVRLYRNVAGTRFRDVAARVQADGACRAARLVDLDGDLLPDLVQVAAGRLTVMLQRSGGFTAAVEKRSLSHGLSLAVGDVDGDSDQDLYVLQSGPRYTSAPDKPDLMLLNQDGHDFTRTAIPQTSAGRGESVVEIDYDRNGLSDFIVLNGLGPTEGPIRLVAFRPAGAR